MFFLVFFMAINKNKNLIKSTHNYVNIYIWFEPKTSYFFIYLFLMGVIPTIKVIHTKVKTKKERK